MQFKKNSMEKNKNTYVCRFCKGSFDQPQNLYKHVQQIHTVRTSSKENRLCSLCGLQYLKVADYRKHLRHIHGHIEEGQVFTFKCFNDFLIWKNELEKRNYCKYVMRTTPKILQHEKIHIYQCDSSNSGMKEKKSGVVVKDVCSSVISATESEKSREIKIEYWNNHTGHDVPVEDNELDAAISSLQTNEIILNDDQNDTEGNIFFLSECNDGSLSNPPGEETPKGKKNSLFMKNSKVNSSPKLPKSSFSKFSYKKDTSKKAGSFQYSLASVACMKSNVKKPADSILIPIINATPNAVTDDSIALLAVKSDTELSSKSENEGTNVELPPMPSAKSQKEGVALSLPISQSTKKDSLSNQSMSPNLTLINNGASGGQLVVLNSIPGQNGMSNFILCPPGTSSLPSNLTLAQSSSRSDPTLSSTVGPLFVVSPSGELSEKENSSSLQNVLTLNQNVQCSPGAEKSLPPGKSILKKQTPTKIQPSKKIPISVAPNSSLEQTLASTQKSFILIEPTPAKRNVKIAAKLSSSQKPVNNLQSSSTNIQSFIAVNSPLDVKNSSSSTPINASVINPNLLSSLQPGQTFMSINNNLIPIVNTTQPFLPSNVNSNFVLASTVSPSPVSKSSPSLLNLATLAPHPIASATSPVVSNLEINKPVATKTLTNAQNLSHSSSVPLLILPSTENLISSTSSANLCLQSVTTASQVSLQKNSIISPSPGVSNITPVISSPLQSSVIKSGLIRPLMSFAPTVMQSPAVFPKGKFFSSSVFQRGARIISSALIPSCTKFIPTPLLPNNMQAVKTSYSSTNLIPVTTSSTQVPSVGKSIVSTTVSNKIQVQKVTVPSSCSARNSISSTSNNVCLIAKSNITESNKVNTVVLNTEPISSTPTINIPHLPEGSEKPETLLMDSSGDVFMLEPVENDQEKTNATAAVYGNKDKTCEKTDGKVSSIDQDKMSTPVVSVDEKISGLAPGGSEKNENRLKVPSPRKIPEIKNGVQIKSVVQEKRPLRDDDVEILKKVKYYQLEMKYLSSQAECKRLKLELAKAQIQNQALLNKEANTSQSEVPNKEAIEEENTNEKLNIESLKLDGVQCIDLEKSSEEQPMDCTVEQDLDDNKSNKSKNKNPDELFSNKNSSGEIDSGKTTSTEEHCDKNTSDQLPSDNNTFDEVNFDKNTLDKVHLDKDIAGEIYSDKSASGEVYSKKDASSEVHSKKDISSEVHSKHDISSELHSKKDASSELHSQKDASSELHSQKDASNELNSCKNLSDEVHSEKIAADEIQSEKNVFVEVMKDLSEKQQMENVALNLSENINILEENPVLENISNVIVIDSCEEYTIHSTSLDESMDVSKSVDEQLMNIVLNEESADSMHDDSGSSKESLKKLEDQYGNESSIDVYTMIRTSVLRSLYEDMKGLHQENEQLFEELKHYKSNEELPKIHKKEL